MRKISFISATFYMYGLCDNILLMKTFTWSFKQNKHDLTGYHFIAARCFWKFTRERKTLFINKCRVQSTWTKQPRRFVCFTGHSNSGKWMLFNLKQNSNDFFRQIYWDFIVLLLKIDEMTVFCSVHVLNNRNSFHFHRKNEQSNIFEMNKGSIFRHFSFILQQIAHFFSDGKCFDCLIISFKSCCKQ